jgi:hypothetical protein
VDGAQLVGTAFAARHGMRDLRKIYRDEAREEASAARQKLAQLRDEVRVRIHLGGMELRDAFDQIEREADHLVRKAEPVAAHVINRLAVRMRGIAQALEGER